MASVKERVEFVRRPEGAAEARGQIARGVIPAAVKVKRQAKGSLAFSSMMSGHDENARDPEHRMPERVDKEAEVLFRHIRQFAEAAGGTLADIICITLYVMDDAYRPTAHNQIAKNFPDAALRPAYHVLNVAPAGLRNERIQAVVALALGD